MRRFLIVAVILGVLILAACGPQPAAAPTEPAPDMANPASVHCGEQGGKLEIRTEAGGEVGYCLFPDGSECEEWAFFRGECGPGGELPPDTEGQGEGAGLANPASVHCGEQGGKLEIRTEAGGEVGYCLFDDGSECEEWAFFRGDCAPGTPAP
jgi:putative hemolysin